MRESESGVVAGDRCRHGIQQPDRGADQGRADRGEGNLSDRQGRAAGEDADNERADDARATVKGGEARRQPGEERSA